MLRQKTKVGIIDYGMGNLTSVRNSLCALRVPCQILTDPESLANYSHFVLPGVGAFAEAINTLNKACWAKPLKHFVINERRPILGICLGMQLLATTSHEFGTHEGLNFFSGEVVLLEPKDPVYHIPHVGWNDVRLINKSKLYQGIPDKCDFYFVHSYYFSPTDPVHITGIADYGVDVTASVEKEGIFAVQFHPEKSGPVGLRLLKNFSEM